MKSIRYIDLDVHKADICSGNEEVRHYGTIANAGASLDAAVRKLVCSGEHLYFVYELGSGGDSIYRYLSAKGIRMHGGGSCADPSQTRRLG